MKLWRSLRPRTVVFVHAGGVDGRMWHPLADRIDGLRLHIPDLRGHGEHAAAAGEYADADDLLRMPMACASSARTLVAASFAAWGRAAAGRPRRPSRVTALALLASTNLDRDDSDCRRDPSFWKKEEALVEPATSTPRVDLGLRVWKPRPGVRDLVAQMTRDAFELQQGVEAEPLPLPVDLGAIAVPTLVVSGGKGPDAPTSPRSPTTSPPRSTAPSEAAIKDAGHLIALERPDATAELLNPWLKRVCA
jgi:pimeloyl-ACP methyl ester carboxylesterase